MPNSITPTSHGSIRVDKTSASLKLASLSFDLLAALTSGAISTLSLLYSFSLLSMATSIGFPLALTLGICHFGITLFKLLRTGKKSTTKGVSEGDDNKGQKKAKTPPPALWKRALSKFMKIALLTRIVNAFMQLYSMTEAFLNAPFAVKIVLAIASALEQLYQTTLNLLGYLSIFNGEPTTMRKKVSRFLREDINRLAVIIYTIASAVALFGAVCSLTNFFVAISPAIGIPAVLLLGALASISLYGCYVLHGLSLKQSLRDNTHAPKNGSRLLPENYTNLERRRYLHKISEKVKHFQALNVTTTLTAFMLGGGMAFALLPKVASLYPAVAVITAAAPWSLYLFAFTVAACVSYRSYKYTCHPIIRWQAYKTRLVNEAFNEETPLPPFSLHDLSSPPSFMPKEKTKPTPTEAVIAKLTDKASTVTSKVSARVSEKVNEFENWLSARSTISARHPSPRPEPESPLKTNSDIPRDKSPLSETLDTAQPPLLTR